MNKRPLSVAIIGWFLIVAFIIDVVQRFIPERDSHARVMLDRPWLSPELDMLMSYVGLIVTLASGIAILKGLNWGRHLFIGWSILVVGVGALMSPYPSLMIIVAAFTAVIAFFLYRPPANLFFRARPA